MASLHTHDCGDNDPRALDSEARFLRVLLASPDGTATLTEATPPEYLDAPFPDGGRWRGGIPKRLAGRGIIGAVKTHDGRPAAHRSSRKARNKGIAGVWRLLDPDAGRRRLKDIESLARLSPHTIHRQPGLFDYLDDGPDAGPVPC